MVSVQKKRPTKRGFPSGGGCGKSNAPLLLLLALLLGLVLWPPLDSSTSQAYYQNVLLQISTLNGTSSSNSSPDIAKDDGAYVHPAVTRSVHHRPSIFCLVPYVWTPQSQQRRLEILNTWGKRCDAIRFLIDPIVQVQVRANRSTTRKHQGVAESVKTTFVHVDQLADMPGVPPLPTDNVVVLKNMKRPWHRCGKHVKTGQLLECRHIWEKVWKSLQWTSQHLEPTAYDWYVKTDWDSFVFPEMIRAYVQKQGWSPHTEHHYVGHEDVHVLETPFISGAMQLFSAKTVFELGRNVLSHPNMTANPPNATHNPNTHCMDGPGQADRPTAVCLQRELQIRPESTRDDQGRERVLLAPAQLMLAWNRSAQGDFWYWKHKPSTVGDMEHCCSPWPLAFHGSPYKKLGELYTIDHFLYGNNNKTTDLFWPRKVDHPVNPYMRAVRRNLQATREREEAQQSQ